MSNKTERFSYKGGCGICERMCVEALKEELGLAIDKQRWVISNMLSSTSDLQPSTVISNLSPGKSFSTNLNHNDTTTYIIIDYMIN